MNQDKKITNPVPDGLSDRLKDKLCAAILAEQGLEALDAAPAERPALRARSRLRRPAARWLWGAVPALAAAALAAVLFAGRVAPPAVPSPATQAGSVPVATDDNRPSDLERAFSAFSLAMQSGYDSFSTPYTPKRPAI